MTNNIITNDRSVLASLRAVVPKRPLSPSEALRIADYDTLREEQRTRREAGDPVQLGIGISVYVEITAGGGGSEYGIGPGSAIMPAASIVSAPAASSARPTARIAPCSIRMSAVKKSPSVSSMVTTWAPRM